MLEFLGGMLIGWLSAIVGRELADRKEADRMERQQKEQFEKELYW